MSEALFRRICDPANIVIATREGGQIGCPKWYLRPDWIKVDLSCQIHELRRSWQFLRSRGGQVEQIRIRADAFELPEGWEQKNHQLRGGTLILRHDGRLFWTCRVAHDETPYDFEVNDEVVRPAGTDPWRLCQPDGAGADHG